MRTDRDVFRFGPFELDSAQRRLMRGRDRVPLRGLYVDLLLLFISHAGEIVSKDALAHAGWAQTFVDDNTVAQGVSRLGRKLGKQEDGTPFIENVVGRGYRFVAPVERDQPPRPNVTADALIGRHRAFVERRAGLETLSCEAIAAAQPDYEEAVRAAPDYAPGHVGLATVYHLRFESTRADVHRIWPHWTSPLITRTRPSGSIPRPAKPGAPSPSSSIPTETRSRRSPLHVLRSRSSPTTGALSCAWRS